MVVYPFERSAEPALILIIKVVRDGAMQKVLCCAAAMQFLHVEGHNPLNFEAIWS